MMSDLIDEVWNDLQQYQSSLIEDSKIISQENNCKICKSQI